MDKIGEKIRYYREQKGWDTVQLAEKSGLSQPYISFIENGKRKPSAKALDNLSEALEVDLHLLVEDPHYRPPGKRMVINTDKLVQQIRESDLKFKQQYGRSSRHSDLRIESNGFSVDIDINITLKNTETPLRISQLLKRSIEGAFREMVNDNKKSFFEHLDENLELYLDQLEYELETLRRLRGTDDDN
jgi:transcriptional regulator with XRE-family HTH domain